MNIFEGLNRIFKLFGVLSGIYFGCYLVYQAHHSIENDMRYGRMELGTALMFLILVFILSYLSAYFFIHVIKLIIFWIIKGFQKKEDEVIP